MSRIKQDKLFNPMEHHWDWMTFYIKRCHLSDDDKVDAIKDVALALKGIICFGEIMTEKKTYTAESIDKTCYIAITKSSITFQLRGLFFLVHQSAAHLLAYHIFERLCLNVHQNEDVQKTLLAAGTRKKKIVIIKTNMTAFTITRTDIQRTRVGTVLDILPLPPSKLTEHLVQLDSYYFTFKPKISFFDEGMVTGYTMFLRNASITIYTNCIN